MTTRIQQQGKPTIYSLGELVEAYGGELIRRGKNISERYGMSTGWNALDNMLRGGGLLPGLLYIVAGRPGMGKTTFMQNMALNIARQGTAVVVFSLEVSKERLLERMAYHEAGIDYMALQRSGQNMSEGQVEAFTNALLRLAELPVYIKDSAGMTPNTVADTLRAWKSEHDFKVMFVDYLHIMRIDERIFGGGREREIGTLVERIRDEAKEQGIACVLLSQMNRETEHTPPFIPALSNLRDSGSIEQVAYCVMALYRRDYYVIAGMMPPDEDGNQAALDEVLDVMVIKQQDGPQGTAKLHFIDGTGRMEDW